MKAIGLSILIAVWTFGAVRGAQATPLTPRDLVGRFAGVVRTTRPDVRETPFAVVFRADGLATFEVDGHPFDGVMSWTPEGGEVVFRSALQGGDEIRWTALTRHAGSLRARVVPARTNGEVVAWEMWVVLKRVPPTASSPDQ